MGGGAGDGCAGALVCNEADECSACGGAGEPCCPGPGSGCDEGFACNDDVCSRCGVDGEPCCPMGNGPRCEAGSSCVPRGGNQGPVCRAECGGRGEPCCETGSGDGCSGAGLQCVDGECVND